MLVKTKQNLYRVFSFIICLFLILFLPVYVDFILIFLYALIFISPYEILLFGLFLDSAKNLPGNLPIIDFPMTIIAGLIILLVAIIKPRIRTNEILEK